MRIKHSRTYHLPWSLGISCDDKVLKSLTQFKGRQVVITEKRDGECTSLYQDGMAHARSIDGTRHPWQDVVKSLWRERCFDLPEGWRVVGENLYATHSIRYFNLIDWFEVFAIFDQTNTALSWEATCEWCDLLGLITVPVIWKGIWDEYHIKSLHRSLDLEKQEGYVVRVADCIPFKEWESLVGKWVRPRHVQTTKHWTTNWESNKKDAIGY